jgi:hypothetical protein
MHSNGPLLPSSVVMKPKQVILNTLQTPMIITVKFTLQTIYIIHICKFLKLPKTSQFNLHKNIIVEFASQNSTECIYIYM